MQLNLFGNDLIQEDRDSYSTPQALYDRENAKYQFEVDAAASRTNRKCPRYFGLDHADKALRNSLDVDWKAYAEALGIAPNFWLNPPYSHPLIEYFMAKTFDEWRKGCTIECLVCPSTCSNWWNDYAIHGELIWIRGRVNFVPPPGVVASTNNRDSVLVLFHGQKTFEKTGQLVNRVEV